MREVHTLLDTKHWMESAIPDPGPNNISTQIGVHFEEVAEMVESLTALDVETSLYLEELLDVLKRTSDHIKQNAGCVDIFKNDRQDYLDSLCDQIVTAVGCAHNSGLDIVGAMNEVNRSNYSKFDDEGKPLFNENMKIIKGPNYSKADLAPYV